ncbi:MAG: enoyl-CoA hydratase/isomerase family protein [Promethearchaeota archaeon]
MNDDNTIILERSGKVAIITLNNPSRLNTFTPDNMETMIGMLNEIKADKKIKSVLIRAEGDRVFSAGLDTNMLASGGIEAKEQVLKKGSELSRTLYYLPKPVVCAIAAPAVGWGFITAMLCDLRFATRNSHFRLPELEIGIYPATGALSLCQMHFGLSRGFEILFLHDKLSAQKAMDVGFVHGLEDSKDDVEKRALSVAKSLARLNQQVIMYSKTNFKLLQPVEFGKALDLEAYCFNNLLKLGKEENWYDKYLNDFETMRDSIRNQAGS